jgi:hypothetical protein
MGTKVAQVLDRLLDRVGHPGRHLDHGLEELGLDPLLLLGPLECLQDLVDAGDELVALAREELELLLDPEAEGRALAEVLFQPVPRPVMLPRR